MRISVPSSTTTTSTAMLWWWLVVSTTCTTSSMAQDDNGIFGDRFNYDATTVRDDGFTDFGPNQWNRINCNENSREGLDACLGYTDVWHEGREWEVEKNYCRWCPIESPGSCGSHHMSPINLERNRGLGFWNLTTEGNAGNPGVGADPMAKECIDVHWMKYEDAWCPLDQLVDSNAFTIERHALRISQPVTVNKDTDELELDCFIEGKGTRFGRIDYSKGFSQWWFLSHIDIHTPSEHTQEGKRYDAEVQLHHFYSVNATVAGVNNELGTVSIFLEVYNDAAPYRYLDKVLCQWRRAEHETRQACGLPPVEDSYPGCFPYHQGGQERRRHRKVRRRAQEDEGARTGRAGAGEGTRQTVHSEYQTVHDWIVAREQHRDNPDKTLPKLHMTQDNWAAPDKSDEEWAAYIAHESAQLQQDDQLWKDLHQEFKNNTKKAHEEFHSQHRQLLMGDEIEWFNYWPMLGVRTEYYYRYSGSMTTPPCYGNLQVNSRSGSLNWRVMKDPIRIHRRQLRELRRLLAQRIQPAGSEVMACQPDTAGRPISKRRVDTARPLQSFHPAHFKSFCECKDWPSKWPEDRAWCDIEDIYERFYDKPYNYDSNGF